MNSCCTYSEPAKVSINSPALAMLKAAILLTLPAYVIYYLSADQGYQAIVPTTHFFSVSSDQGDVLLEDIFGSTLYSYNELLIQDTEDTIFVTTSFEDSIEEYTSQCNGTSTNESVWCTLNKTSVTIPADVVYSFNINVVSRISCDGIIFSNFPRSNPKLWTEYRINLREMVLSRINNGGEKLDNCGKLSNLDDPSMYSACCDTTCPYSGYIYGNGLDVSLDYIWSCDLDKYTEEERYICAADTLSVKAEAISSSSIITTANLVTSPTATIRRRKFSKGVFIRFRGTGGCTKTTVQSVLGLLAEAFAINGVGLVVIGICVFIYSKIHDFKIPELQVGFTKEADGTRKASTFISGAGNVYNSPGSRFPEPRRLNERGGTQILAESL